MGIGQKHTQTPWRQFDDGDNATEIMGADGPTVAITNAELGVRDINEAKANAALIVRAVNNHDALVEALRLVVTRYDISRDIHWRQLGLPRPQDDDNDTIRTARAALAATQETK